MLKWIVVLMAALGLGMSWPIYPLARAAVTSTADVTLKPDPNVKPVAPVNPDGSGQPSPGDAEDPGNQGTGSQGHLTLDYISNLKFKQQGLTDNFITATATDPQAVVQISDRRGTGTGWNLMLKPGALVGQTDGSSLTAATLSLGYAYFLASGTNFSRPPRVMASSGLPLGSYSLIARAQNQPGDRQGMGTWLLRLNTRPSNPMTLSVLASSVSRQQTYRGTLDWLLTDTPQ